MDPCLVSRSPHCREVGPLGPRSAARGQSRGCWRRSPSRDRCRCTPRCRGWRSLRRWRRFEEGGSEGWATIFDRAFRGDSRSKRWAPAKTPKGRRRRRLPPMGSCASLIALSCPAPGYGRLLPRQRKSELLWAAEGLRDRRLRVDHRHGHRVDRPDDGPFPLHRHDVQPGRRRPRDPQLWPYCSGRAARRREVPDLFQLSRMAGASLPRCAAGFVSSPTSGTAPGGSARRRAKSGSR